MSLTTHLERLMQRQHLSAEICEQLTADFLNPASNSLHLAALLVLLRAKPETAEEIISIAAVLRKRMVVVNTKHKVLDIAGTGGDGANTINISTGGALLAATCGVKIAKHGNRAVSSRAGSADVLEALGINIQLTPEKVAQCIDKVGIGFCYAPLFHPALQAVRELRKQLKVATIFNLLGPLLNPTNPQHILLGVYDAKLLPVFAQAIQQKTEKSMIVNGCQTDELTSIGPTTIYEIVNKNIVKKIFEPSKVNFSVGQLSDLKGGNAEENAAILLEIFSGNYREKYKIIADTLVLNAATALYLFDLAKSIDEAIPQVFEKLHSGSTLKLIKSFKECSHD